MNIYLVSRTDLTGSERGVCTEYVCCAESSAQARQIGPRYPHTSHGDEWCRVYDARATELGIAHPHYTVPQIISAVWQR